MWSNLHLYVNLWHCLILDFMWFSLLYVCVSVRSLSCDWLTFCFIYIIEQFCFQSFLGNVLVNSISSITGQGFSLPNISKDLDPSCLIFGIILEEKNIF